MNGLLNASDMLAELQGELQTAKTAPNCDIIICPPFPYIQPFGQILGQKTPQISLGGQDCHPQETGAHTGDISAEMLADIGAKFVIIGHSERRANHGETDAIIAQKTHAAWRAGLCAIVCVGETLAERAEAQTVVARQLQTSLPDGATPANLSSGFTTGVMRLTHAVLFRFLSHALVFSSDRAGAYNLTVCAEGRFEAGAFRRSPSPRRESLVGKQPGRLTHLPLHTGLPSKSSDVESLGPSSLSGGKSTPSLIHWSIPHDGVGLAQD